MFLGLIVTLALIAGLFFLNWQRANTETSFELTPNCLLTRHPIVFLTGHRSLFYFLAYWNEVPAFLTAHGYQIYVMALPWKSVAAKKFLTHYFRRRAPSDQKFHFIIDASLYPIFDDLLRHDAYPQIASISCIGHLQTEDPTARTSLKGPRLPIEDIPPQHDESFRRPWWWSLHLIATGQAQMNFISYLGWPFVRPQYEIFLKHASTLAERDLIQGG